MEPEYTKYILGKVNSQQYQSNYNSIPPHLTIKKECYAHSDLITSLLFYQSGNSFISTSMDGYVMDWDTESFDFKNDYYIGHTGLIYGTTDENNYVAVICADGSVSLIDKRSGKYICIETPRRKATKCCFCQNDLVIGYNDGIIKCWNIAQQKFGDTIEQHHKSITSLSSKKNEIMSASTEGTVGIWDVIKKEKRYTFSLDKSIMNCKYVPNGKMLLLLMETGDAFFYKLENNSKSQYFYGFNKINQNSPFDFLTDTREGQFLKKFIVNSDGINSINFWSVETMKCIQSIPTDDITITALSCHPTEMFFITGGDLSDTSIKLWK
ncbi:WD repeatcontaining protein [Entamoeba histolytica KU27]|uniref:WD repeatcontaining protein n=1 Tax=Entamoeba histolytica KU27 TaxID=885311 RepID=M2QH96_ENTHI|nr:WD repeatcontaining protein [Entamoeba histolytica KU27]